MFNQLRNVWERVGDLWVSRTDRTQLTACLCGPRCPDFCVECGFLTLDHETGEAVKMGHCRCYIVEQDGEEEELVCDCESKLSELDDS